MESGPAFRDDGCLSDRALERLEAGERLDHDAEAHLGQCNACTDRLERLATSDDLLVRLRLTAPTDGDGEQGRLPAGYIARRELHRGAQGVVFEAWHEATKRAVAVKLLLGGRLSTSLQRARFEREVELAASLDHPGIVAIYDSGVTPSGEPYIAMELFRGRPLAAPVGGTTNPEATARLMSMVCDAVAHAHQRGVIHRDLKPSNILVDDRGAPKVIDFGIARHAAAESGGTGSLTADDAFLGTLGYSAPEQVRGQSARADTRTDVYALGLVLYELLTGRMAQGAGDDAAEVMQRVVSTTPTPPAMVRRHIGAELSAIAMRAIEKEPSRRYQSAGEMAADLDRFLAGRPVMARGAGAVYVARKFLARHPRAAAGVSVALVLLGVAAVGLWWTSAAGRRAELAKTGVRDSLYQMLLQANIDEAQGADVRELLRRHAPIVDERLADFPLERAEVNAALGDAMMSRDLLPEALERYNIALADRLSAVSGADASVAAVYAQRGEVLWRLARYEEALRSFQHSKDQFERLSPTSRIDLAEIDRQIGSTLTRLGRLDEAEALLRSVAEGLSGASDSGMILSPPRQAGRTEAAQHSVGRSGSPRAHADHAMLLANTLNSLGVCLAEQGRPGEAIGEVDRAMEIVLELPGDHGREIARLLSSRSSYLIALGRFEEAEVALDRAIELKRKWRGVDDRDVARSLHERATLTGNRIPAPRSGDDFAALGRAAGYAAEALAIRSAAHRSTPHPEVAESLLILGQLRRLLGSAIEAELILRRSIAEWEASGQTERRGYRLAHDRLARALAQLGRESEALEHAQKAWELHLRVVLNDSGVPAQDAADAADTGDLVASLCDAVGEYERGSRVRVEARRLRMRAERR